MNTISPSLSQRRTWILVIIALTCLLLGQNAVLARSSISTQNPRTTSVQPPGYAAIKTIDVQVTDSKRTADLGVLSPTALDTGEQPLHDFYFYIDAGHNAAGGPPNPPNPPDCSDRGASSGGVYEADLVWNIAYDLEQILLSNGVPQSQIFMSRPTATQYATVDSRALGTSYTTLCSTYGDNQAFMDSGSPIDKWRFISIHLNANGNERVEVFRKVTDLFGEPQIPLADDFAENMMWEVNRAYSHPNPPYWGDWTRANDPTVCNPTPCDLGVVRLSKPRAWEDPDPTRNPPQPGSYNILAELGYLDDQNFNAWIVQTNNQQAEAQAIYRGFADFFVVGKQGSIHNKDQDIFNDYRLNITSGRDPGTPLDNGGGYYVHQYGNALDQDFIYIAHPTLTRGSILKPAGGGAAHYVRDPLWATYIQKSGPNSNGPGLPVGEEHSWTASRRACQGCQSYVYDKVVNFERGAIIWNSYEGGITPGYAQHGIFIPNCNASGIDDFTYGPFLRGMVGRFALGNDLDTRLDDPNNPTPALLGGYTDADLHVYDSATRGQVAQNLAWTEAFQNSNTNWGYTDTQNHWARPFINIVADHGIANGYINNPPCTTGIPCFLPSGNVTRGQFAKMESLARGWALVNPPAPYTSPACPNGYNSFSDVCSDNEFYTVIETVKVHNAISGYNTYPPCDANAPAPCFRLYNPVVRGQMAKIIDAALTNDHYYHQACWYGSLP